MNSLAQDDVNGKKIFAFKFSTYYPNIVFGHNVPIFNIYLGEYRCFHSRCADDICVTLTTHIAHQITIKRNFIFRFFYWFVPAQNVENKLFI